jgi:RNA polymerase sigma factor (sigma-70 family)
VERDAALIADMVRGESGAFADLYRNYRTRLHQYALSLTRSRMEAEDVVHDVFIGLARQASAGRAPRDVSAYLYASVRHRCIDRMRRKPEVSLDDVDIELFVAPPGDEERIRLGRLLHRALLALPAEQAEVVVLRIWHDLAFAAIARIQGTSVNTCLSRYQYGLAKLRKEFGADER